MTTNFHHEDMAITSRVEDLEAEAERLRAEIATREAEEARAREKTLDILKSEEEELARKITDAKRRAAEERAQRHKEARARLEADLANAEATRRDLLQLWRESCLALGRLADLSAQLSRDAIVLREYQPDDPTLTVRANAALAPPNPRVEAGGDLQIGTTKTGWDWRHDVLPAWLKKH